MKSQEFLDLRQGVLMRGFSESLGMKVSERKAVAGVQRFLESAPLPFLLNGATRCFAQIVHHVELLYAEIA